MPKSKLEACEDILQALVSRPLTFERMAQATNIDDALLKRNLNFLKKNSLVEERVSGRKPSFAITERGIAVLRALNFQKYLSKIKNTVRAIDEAMQIIPDINENYRQLGKEARD